MTNVNYKIDGYVNDIIVTSWDKNIKDFKIAVVRCDDEFLKSIEIQNSNNDIYSLISRFVNIKDNEIVLDSLKVELKDLLNIDVVMFRHIAVFDSPKRDPRGYIISNLMLAIVDDVNTICLNDDIDIKLFTLKELEKVKLCLDYQEMLVKFQKIIDYDIYSQIFDTQKFGSDFIVSLLGEKFTTSELIELAKWAGRRENKTTFYRNIDNNYKFLEKVGRNKYYTKKYDEIK